MLPYAIGSGTTAKKRSARSNDLLEEEEEGGEEEADEEKNDDIELDKMIKVIEKVAFATRYFKKAREIRCYVTRKCISGEET